jgi:NTE family protein
VPPGVTIPSVPAPDLAVPRSFDARYGEGVDRGLCLGGGGLFFVAWQAAYLTTLEKCGVTLDRTDRIVGTSAGSVIASALAKGRLGRLHTEVSVLSKVPAVVSALAPASQLHPSQQRALELFIAATDAEPETIRAIGHAALSARTPEPSGTRRTMGLVLGAGRWNSDSLHITCVDAYTGERCVLTRQAGTTIPRAVAASSAVPGIFAPQPIADRRLMDGGVSGTGTHLDLFAGSKRALILALTDGADQTEGMMTSHPEQGREELENLEKSGTDVLIRTPSTVDLTQLMSPAAAPGALALGAAQGLADAGLVRDFWS